MLRPNIWEEHKNHLNKQQLIQINLWTLTATMVYTMVYAADSVNDDSQLNRYTVNIFGIRNIS